jgi:hypothetical protein
VNGSAKTYLRGHLLQILNILIPGKRLSLVPAVQTPVLVLQSIYLITIILIFLLVAMSLLVNVTNKLIQPLYYSLLHVSSAEGKILSDLLVTRADRLVQRLSIMESLE